MNIGVHLLTGILLCGLVAEGQVTANFSVSKTSGCSPQTIYFTDLSTGPVNYWEWHFGNGNVSFLQNPGEIYGAPGTYTVTLIVSDGTNRDTLTLVDYIRIFKNPEARFKVNGPTAGCEPFPVMFNDSTVVGDTAIVSWKWDFGDGTIDNSGNPNPTHIYATPGTYPVSLQVTDANGCSSNILFPNYITVSETPTAGFTANVTSACAPPLTVTFTNQSTGGGTLTYLWDFGDGGTSSDPNPIYTYTDTGSFTVKLVVTNAAGCKDSVVLNGYINVIVPVSSFTAPDTVCVNQNVPFTNMSSGGTLYRWNFGDGATSSAANPTHPYASTGTYTVRFVVLDPTGTCTDTSYRDIVVIDIAPDFTSSPNYGCKVPHTVNFTDLTADGVSWLWNFGDGGTSSQQNPVHTYNTPGTYTITLEVTNKFGCKKTITKTNHVIIRPPTANFIPDKVEGCAPLTVNFTDISVSDSTVTGWYWDFGDGGTDTVQNPTYIFNSDSDFTVTLVITNKLGCTDTVRKVIEVGTKIPPNFTLNPDTSCAWDPVSFTDLTGDPRIDEWLWINFGDGGSSNIPNPTHQYTDTGYMDVTLVIGYNGCYDTLKIDSMVYIKGPIVNFAPLMSCDSPYVYQFFSNMIDAQRWYWDFGDGSPLDSVSVNPVHTYGSRGTYTIKLTGYNDTNNCYWEALATIQVTDIIARLSPDTIIGCKPFNKQFSGATSQDGATYLWNFGDGTGNQSSGVAPTRTHIYASTGYFTLMLVVTDVNGCKDTTYGQVRVIDPTAKFSVDTVEGCVPLPVNFTDSSFSDTTIVGWFWNFGDGGTSTQQNPTHIYTTNGTKTVTLIVTDAIGCKDTIVKTNVVNSKQPTPNFTVSDQTICRGDSVTFTDGSSGKGPFSYLWNFGDGGTSSLPNPTHTYNDTGYFAVTLTIVDQDGCDSTLVKTTYIHVQGIPIALIASNITTSVCYPQEVLFRDSSISGYISSWEWTFGDGGNSVLQNPGHNYTQPGEYDVSLIVTTTYGCTDTIELLKYIKINGPFATFYLLPDTACKGDTITYVIDSTYNLATWEWGFGDGNIVPGTGLTTTHIYNQTGRLGVTLKYNDASGNCPKSYTDSVFIHEVIAGFGITDTSSCVPLVTAFVDGSTGPNLWQWDFGDGGTSAQANPNYTYSTPGNYGVTLVILNSATGCRDTARKTVYVYPPPVITVTPDRLLCIGDSIRLVATGGVSYLWTPSTWLSDTTVYNPWAKPSSDIQYNVSVVDQNGCTGTDSVRITIQYAPNMSLPPDTIIIIGETVDSINGYAGSGFLYTWSPTKWLSCADCPMPGAQPLEDICYELRVTDANGCFLDIDTMCIKVIEKYSIDVPKAFTPNGDGTNDIIYVKGWGIKRLLEFKIYNRWGELLFDTNDINEGWNGYYKGVLQNIETYVYVASGETYSGKVLTKKGYIHLLR